MTNHGTQLSKLRRDFHAAAHTTAKSGKIGAMPASPAFSDLVAKKIVTAHATAFKKVISDEVNLTQSSSGLCVE